MTQFLDENDQPLINIPLMAHKRANREALERLGATWTATHDRFVARWLFKNGHISDFERERLMENIAEKVARTKKKFPDYGRWRVW